MTTSDYNNYSVIDVALQLGGRAVDLDTGEIYQTDNNPAGPSGREEDGPGGGLSTGHICTWVGGNLVQVCASKKGKPPVLATRRGKIQGFSKKSRRRLMQKISMTKKSCLPMFVTLTYPGEFSEDPKVWKRDLQVFWMRFVRRFPDVGAVWKLEFQKRGAPHYHLLVWGVSYIDLLRFVPEAWYQVVGSGDVRHFNAGTRVEQVRSWRGVMAYASKYLAKLESVPYDAVGRFWGVKGNIPWADMVQISLTDREAFQFIRLLRRMMRIKSRAYRSLTAFSDGEFWLDRLDRLLCLFS